MTEKLQKVLARAGLGSRRHIETYITEGRILVDGKKAKLGDRVDHHARIAIDGKRVFLTSQGKRYVLMYYKPEGEISTRSDPEGRPTVFDRLPSLTHQRWIHIGRLDINSQGLLLFTNDGELAHRLLHPSYKIEREYTARVFGEVTSDMLKRLKTGITLEDGFAAFKSIEPLPGGTGLNRWYRVTLEEGRTREVRRLWESQGVKVSRLTRIRFGSIELPRWLSRGRWAYLTPEQVSELSKAVGLH